MILRGLVSLLCLGVLAGQASCAPDAKPCTSNPEQTARSLFAHWTQNKHKPTKSLGQTVKRENTTAVLKQLGQLLPDERCLFWFAWDPVDGLSFEKPTSHHCYRSARQQTANHLLLYRRWMERAISAHGAGSSDGPLRHKFHFYVDLSDGHRFSPELAEALGAPILVQSKWSGDSYSIPIPGAHWVAAQLLVMGVSVKDAAAVQKGAAQAYNTSAPPDPLPWADRTPRLAFRSCCKPTPDTRSTATPPDTRSTATPPAHVYPLGDICTATQGLPDFDISVSLCSLWATCERGQLQPLCNGCLNCVQHRTRIPRSLRSTFRYQLAPASPSGTADATLQQLLTGSAVLALQAEGEGGRPLRLHEQWYLPLLRDRTHYLLTTAKQLPATKKWCDDNSDTCHAIAEAGRRVATCDITLEAGLRYTYLVLKHIHDLAAQQ